MKHNYWLSGIMGLVVGDALGCPVEFQSRDQLKSDPVTDMRGFGTFNLPAGSWTDDSSMALALLESLKKKKGVDLIDIMGRFVRWYKDGKYTPFGKAFDIGGATLSAIHRFERDRNVNTCGGTEVSDNGNGSLMRILPICIYATEQGYEDKTSVWHVHKVSGLTHNHLRSKIACGLYYFLTKSILLGEGDFKGSIGIGLNRGFAYYMQDPKNETELSYYMALSDIENFSKRTENEIKSSSYVVDSLEAAIWCLVTTENFAECILKAVNLGEDTDTIAAIAGGLAGLCYGYDGIPKEWLEVIQRREWIEKMCQL